jgi:hypothetical protein
MSASVSSLTIEPAKSARQNDAMSAAVV